MAVALTAEAQAAITPDQALHLLKEGNSRFLNGARLNRDLSDQVSATADGQFPFAMILGCIDSRVPHEIVFDAGLGDLFSARVAGNFVNQDILGSMEFATAVAGAKLIVVLGHSECGAVKGACDHVELGNLTALLSNLRPALDYVASAAHPMEEEMDSGNSAYVQAVAEANVALTVTEILRRSPVIAGQVQEGAVRVVGAMHDVYTGQVQFIGDEVN